jgi:hypothetical protein
MFTSGGTAMRIAMMGSGGIGGYVGARLAAAGAAERGWPIRPGIERHPIYFVVFGIAKPWPLIQRPLPRCID